VFGGTPAFRIGDAEVPAHASETVLVPRGMPHAYWNPLPGTARCRIAMPARIRDPIDAIHPASDRSPAPKQLFRRYESELLV